MNEKAKSFGITNLTPVRRSFLVHNVIISQLVMKQYAFYGTSYFLFRAYEVLAGILK